MKQLSIDECAGSLKELSGTVLILTHINPDGDTLGSAFALARILRAKNKKAYVFGTSSVPARFRFLSRDRLFIREVVPEPFSVVAVDVASQSQLGDDIAEMFGDRIEIAIDHHVNNTVKAAKKLVMSDRAAAGEIVYDLAVKLGVEVNEDIAQALYTAISSDSGGFRFSSTSPSTHRIAAALLETGIDFADIDRMLFDTVTQAQFVIAKLAYSILERYCDGRVAWLMFTPELLAENGIEEPDYGDTSQFGRRLEGVEVGITVRPNENGSWRVSMRSNKFLNVSEIAESFGGGGHYFASAFTIEGTPEEVRDAILGKVVDRL